MIASFSGSAVRSLRATGAEWDRWRGVAVARGFTLNRWARRTLNLEADRVESEVRRHDAEKAERRRLMSVVSGFCPHRVAAGAFCKRCEDELG